MITKLKLTNFKQHENREFSFTSGLQLIKGENEAGKSNLLQGISYALFGARALPMSLSDTVTWGKAESTLRVDLWFSHAGIDYHVYRQKSGAELRGGGVVASGQSEVTKFVEGLFGTADIANSLMLAQQNKLKGTMTARPGDSTGLIERLARFDLLEAIVGSIQQNMPCGSTNAIAAMLAKESALPEPAAPDTAELQLRLEIERGKLAALASERDRCVSDLMDLPLKEADALLALESTLKAEYAQRRAQREAAALASDVAVPELVEPDWAAIDTKERDYKEQAETFARYSKVLEAERLIAAARVAWSGDEDCLDAATVAGNLKQNQITKELQDLQLTKGQKLGAKVKSGECSFCGLLLDDVPQVIALNAKLDEELAELAEREEALTKDAVFVESRLRTLTAAKRLAAELRRINLPAEVIKSTEHIPWRVEWNGPIPVSPGKAPDFAALRTTLRQQHAEARQAHEAQALAVARHKDLVTQVAGLKARLDGLDVASAHTVKNQAQATSQRMESLRQAAETKKEVISELVTAISNALVAYETQKEAYAKSLALRAEYSKTIAVMELNNRVVKRIREVRPEVAAKLWKVVLSTVNHYFSKVRGVQSVVTRGESGFLVDGRPAEGLSGSAQDALGLAERIALTKTFLPNVGFIVLDEPAAAASDVRETNMLATLAGAGFEQIIMVSHSNLADAFANNLLEL